MVGLLVWKEPRHGGRQKQMTVRERNIFRMRCLQIEILRGRHTPDIILRQRMKRVGTRLRKLGITRVVLPEENAGLTLPEGLQPVSTLALRQALAADWVQKELAEKKISAASARVAVCGTRLSGEVVRTVTELSLRHRYVLVDLPYGGDELGRRLRKEYGVSLLVNPDKAQLDEAETLVLFDARGELKRKNPVVIPLYDEAALMPQLILPPVLEEKLPKGVDRVQMLAALLQAGAIRAGVDLTF